MKPDQPCATCGDVAERATILSIDGANAIASRPSGARIEIAIDLTPGAGVGDVVLVHQGVAIGMSMGLEGRTS